MMTWTRLLKWRSIMDTLWRFASELNMNVRKREASYISTLFHLSKRKNGDIISRGDRDYRRASWVIRFWVQFGDINIWDDYYIVMCTCWVFHGIHESKIWKWGIDYHCHTELSAIIEILYIFIIPQDRH
jgi:hypothetical protein